MRSSIAGELPNRNSVPPNFSKSYWNVKVSSSKVVARGPLMSLWMTTLPLVSAGAGPGLQPHVNTGRWGRGEGSRQQGAGLPGSSQPGWDVNVFESISASGLCRSHTSAWKTNRPLSGSKHHQNLNAKVLLGHRHTFLFLLPWECLKKFFSPGPKRNCHAKESLLLRLHLSYTMFFT